jgi:hypothetical protein
MPVLHFTVQASTHDALKRGVLALPVCTCTSDVEHPVDVWVDGPDDTTLLSATAVNQAALVAAQMAATVLDLMPTRVSLIY